MTPWTDPTKVAVPGYATYSNRPTALCNLSMLYFQNYMNNLTLPFSFDSAVAVMK